MSPKFIASAYALLLSFSYSFAQEAGNATAASEEMSIFEYFKGDKASSKQTQNSAPAQPKTFYLSGIPVLSSNPVVGTAFGAVANGAFVIGGDYMTTNFSAVTTSVVYTTNQQTTFAVNNFLYFKENAWLLQCTFNYRIFPMFTWGVGGNTPDGWASRLENNGFLFDQMLLKSLGSNWFVGGGININYVYGQEDGNVETP